MGSAFLSHRRSGGVLARGYGVRINDELATPSNGFVWPIEICCKWVEGLAPKKIRRGGQ
jgi:hypothetical protein